MHEVQALQLGASTIVLKVSFAHAAHVRSAVALPLVVTACPATQ